MVQLNRREFLYGGAAASAAAALMPHMFAASSAVAPQASPTVAPDAAGIPLQYGEDPHLITWREQGVSLGGQAVHYSHFAR